MDRKSLTRDIKRKAKEIGFNLSGITSAEPLREDHERLTAWLGKGHHASMDWMKKNTHRRSDPQLSLQNARSILSLAMNYYTPFEHEENDQAGKISRYGWGDDYHHILRKRLRLLERSIQELASGTNTRSYVDTGPVLEKTLAQNAGLGWVGKHTLLINREYGSWIFLAEVITDLELEFDTPATDQCGTCRACIDACPTQAITEERILDSRRCISYLTIEHRGEFDKNAPASLHGWVFGCDICQDVCPWNRFQKPTEHDGFAPRVSTSIAFDEIESMTDEAFASKFEKSPIRRPKLAGLKRNIARLRS